MKEGDFIKIEFDAFAKETDQLVDTTHEDVAKEHEVYNERAKYIPMSVIVGAGTIVKGLDDSLLEAEVDKDVEVEIGEKDAFGEKDPKLIEVFPMNKILSLPEFRKGDHYPTEGMEIRINNRIGIINRIFAGRVRVDFNHRWAGKTIVYKYKVTEVIEGKEDKMKALLEAAYPNTDEFSIEMQGDDQVDIILPDIVKLDTNWAMAKFRIVSDLRKHLDLKTVRMIEVYVKKEEEEPKEEEHECDDPNCDHDHSKDEEKAEEESSEVDKEDEPQKKSSRKKASPKKKTEESTEE
jgi:FKBP-type peptidyl-prolyl cis-trans isomerase 2